MFMKQRVKQLAITERSVKMKKIVAVVIIMFIFSIIILGEGSKLVFQKICERRETAWPDLGTADDEQYEWLTEAYKIKRKNNEKIVILASDGTKLEGHYYERKKNAPLVIFFHGFRGHSYVDGVPIYKIAQKEKWNVLLVSMRAHDESEGNIFTLGVKERYDCVNWANWAAKHFGRETPIFLMGISMGGAVVTMSSNLDFPDSVCGIIEDSGFTTSTKMLELNCKSHLPKGMPVEVFKIFADVGIKLWGGFNLKEADACKAVSQTKIPNCTYFVDMISHPEKAENYFKLLYLKIIQRNNWMEHIGYLEIPGMVPGSQAFKVTSEEDIFELYSKGPINIFLEIENKGYISWDSITSTRNPQRTAEQMRIINRNIRKLNNRADDYKGFTFETDKAGLLMGMVEFENSKQEALRIDILKDIGRHPGE